MDTETTQTIVNQAVENSYMTLGLLGISILGTMLGYINREVLGRVSKKLLSKVMFRSPPSADVPADVSVEVPADDILNLELNNRVQEVITDLRILSRADRVSVFQFHNGSVFRTKEPIWKISTTHESASIGTASASNQCQDTKASLFTTLLVTLYNKESATGIQKVHDVCSSGGPCIGRRGVYTINPQAVASTFITGFIINRGSTFSVVAPLLDDDDNIIGFLLVDYCDSLFDINNVPDSTKELWYNTLCRSATQISVQLLMSCRHEH